MPPENPENGIVLKAFKHDAYQQDSNSKLETSHTEETSAKPGKIRRCDTPLPQAKSNLLSFCTYHWLTPLVREIARTEKEGFDENALWSCANEDGCQQNGQRLKKLWQTEIRRKGYKDASFFNSCVNFLIPLYWRLFFGAVIFTVNLTLLTILVFRNLLKYLQYGGQGPYYGYLLAGCIFIMSLIQICCLGYLFSLGNMYGTRLKGAAMYLVYETILQTKHLRKSALAEVINVFTTDSLRIYMWVYRLQLVPVLVTLTIGGLTATWFLVGWWTFVAVLTFGVVIFFQTIMTMISSNLQEKRLTHTDSRIQMMKEVLMSIRLIKTWAWEKPFLAEIVDERKKETSKSEKMAFLTSLGLFQNAQAPAIATVVTLTLYAYFGNQLTTELAFTVSISIGALRQAFFALPVCGRHLADVLVSCKRIKALLLRQGQKQKTDIVTDDKLAIQIIDASFRWPVDQTPTDSTSMEQNNPEGYHNQLAVEQSNSSNGHCNSTPNVTTPHLCESTNPYALQNISFEVAKGSLIGICGKVGSGKSALVSALLGQMHRDRGSSAVNGSVALCPQEPWIFNDTVRENILFGSSFDKRRYERVLDLTCFDADLASFPSADLSEVGERGITLSGGQRQRLSLARALYSNRDIYVLDDPLSALDVTVGQQVFTRCIKEALKDKTVILVTHQLQYLPECDQVIVLEDGMVSEFGTPSELMSQGREYAYLMGSFYDKIKEKKDKPKTNQRRPTTKGSVVNRDSGAGRLTEKETIEHGHVSWATYKSYIRALGGATVFFFLILSFVLAEAVALSGEWWLTAWLQQIDSMPNSMNATIIDNTTIGSNVTQTKLAKLTRIAHAFTGVASLKLNLDQSIFIRVYGLVVVAIILANCLRCWALAKTTMRSSRVLHTQVLEKVMGSPVSFFDKTPLGRIMNRFSSDIDIVDTYISQDGGLLLKMTTRLTLAIASLCAVFPILVLVLIPVVILISLVGRLGRASMRQMKRMDHASRSALVDHVASTIHGMDSVCAYERQALFSKRMVDYMDKNSVRSMTYANCVDWLFSRADIIAYVFNLVTAVLVVTFRHVIPAQLGGLALSIAVQTMMFVGPFVQIMCQVEAWFTSVERLNEYVTTLKPEGQQKVVTTFVDSDWPRIGDVAFNDVSMSYDTSSAKVLKKVSFNVMSGQKVGIIGRTGSGKSSLGVALFRLVELSSGNISIDGVDISELDIHHLRSRLSVIPQEPELFVGTLRRNLDPFQTCTDKDIWAALEKSQLKEKVMGLKGRLEYYVEDNGDNFSVGERQLLCMSRTLLRNARIVLLDEATANVDTETDSKIQLMVKECFTGCTVFIIAHRLNTIQHCDKILVMDDGKVYEFDSPESLLNRPDSMYRSMLNANRV